jgi:hypothetical protein
VHGVDFSLRQKRPLKTATATRKDVVMKDLTIASASADSAAQLSGPKPPAFPTQYPDGKPKPINITLPDGTAMLSPIVMGDAIPLTLIPTDVPYVLCDDSNRVLCVEKGGSPGWEWSYMGQYASYPADVFPIRFSSDPIVGATSMYARVRNEDWYLFPRTQATSWNYLFWGPSSYSPGYPIVKVQAEVMNPEQTKFKLYWMNGTTKMYLCCDGGSWNWLFVGGSGYAATVFTLRRFYVERQKMILLFQSAWPSATFNTYSMRNADTSYQCIDDDTAHNIWNKSGLSNFKYRKDVFDCDDFSFVYKGEASKQAYNANAEFGYSVGLIWGFSPTVGHAVNVFVDYSANVRVLEPQNNSIVAGSEWKDNKGAKYQPSLIVL